MLTDTVSEYVGLAAARIGQDDKELFAPVAPGKVIFANHMLECRGKLDQHLVTKAMSETIIDLFEVIKINEHDGKWLLRLLGVVEVLRELSLNPGAVGQLGQVVGAVFRIEGHVASVQRFELSSLIDKPLIDGQTLFEQ